MPSPKKSRKLKAAEVNYVHTMLGRKNHLVQRVTDAKALHDQLADELVMVDTSLQMFLQAIGGDGASLDVASMELTYPEKKKD